MTPEQALKRIAEIDGPIECTSLQDWRWRVKEIARLALNEMKTEQERRPNYEHHHSQ